MDAFVLELMPLVVEMRAAGKTSLGDGGRPECARYQDAPRRAVARVDYEKLAEEDRMRCGQHKLIRHSKRLFHVLRWHLDEVVLKITGIKQWLWRAVDANGDVLDIL